jgi:hypothetical protein
MTELFPIIGEDAHVNISSQQISVYMDVDRFNVICFRCGEAGHVRFQCMTFRVRTCPLFSSGLCFDQKCTYAHAPEELRTPWKARCVRVIKQGGQLVCIGCNSEDHTFRKCPLHQDLILL